MQVSPAVGSYEALPSIGKQPLSTFKTLPACSFARGSSREQEHKRFMSPEHARMKQVCARQHVLLQYEVATHHCCVAHKMP